MTGTNFKACPVENTPGNKLQGYTFVTATCRMNSNHLESMQHVAGTIFCPRDKISHGAYDGIRPCNMSPRFVALCVLKGRTEPKWRRSAFAEHRIKQRQRNIINTLQTQHQKSLKIQQYNESYETKGQADLQARTEW